MDLGIDGNAAFVSAASSGLGFATASAFAAEGTDVAICARGTDRLATATSELREAGDGSVLSFQADITDRSAITGAIEETASTFGGLEHLVTSAGGPPTLSLRETEDEDWYAAFDVLVMSAVWAVKAAEPYLSDGGGSIVHITSRTDEEIIDGHVLSNAVRRAVVGLMKSNSVELAPAIRSNAVLPGPHDTDRLRGIASSLVEEGVVDSHEAFLASAAEDIPVDRIGDPQELGETAVWLASERASFINGRTLLLDGGAIRSV